jgi:hypothetical protein
MRSWVAHTGTLPWLLCVGSVMAGDQALRWNHGRCWRGNCGGRSCKIIERLLVGP